MVASLKIKVEVIKYRKVKAFVVKGMQDRTYRGICD